MFVYMLLVRDLQGIVVRGICSTSGLKLPHDRETAMEYLGAGAK